MFSASELAGIEPTPPAPKGAGYVVLDHSATASISRIMISSAQFAEVQVTRTPSPTAARPGGAAAAPDAAAGGRTLAVMTSLG